MAENSPRDRLPLTPSRLGVLADLTKAVGEAVTQGDLDRALALLKERQAALGRLDWSGADREELAEELPSLMAMEGEILEFCRTWRETLAKRLETLNAHHQIQQRYDRQTPEAKFVDVRK
jgi:hypothetical protein